MPAPLRHSFVRRSAVHLVVLLSMMLGDASVGAEPDAGTGEPNADADGAAALEVWQREIRPLLDQHCTGCHGAAKRSSELSLRSIADVLAGGDRGPAIDHADPSSSWLLEVLAADADPHMPPDEQLGEEQIETLRRWTEMAAAIEPSELLALAEEQPPVSRPANPGGYPAGVEPRLVIDMAVQAGWQAEQSPITPAGRCDDGTFVRRLYLDLAGRVPTADERDAFLSDPRSDKRERLVDHLLGSPEHARHIAELFDTILMGRGSVATMKRRSQHGWNDFLVAAFAENRPWDQTVRQILVARPQTPAEAGASWYLYERKNQHQQIAEAVSAGIFGVDIQCAQCHDHPLADEIKQAHYWGLVAFFNRGKNTDTPSGPRVAESAVGGFANFTNLTGLSQPNRLVYLQSAPVEEPRPAEGQEQEDGDDLYEPGVDGEPRVPKFSRRQQFADQVLRDHPLLARAMVNRLWALVMGRGLVHPVDRLESTHPPSHPELLDWLADDFARSGYDVRRMMRQLALSDTYQLASESDSFVDPARFAVAVAKPLSAETLHRSMLVALDVRDLQPWQTPEQLAEFREAFPDVLAEKSIATVRQALLLTNGSHIHELLTPEHSGTLVDLARLPAPETVAEAAFVRILGRVPDEEERQHAVAFLQKRASQENRGIDQLVWSLLTSAEFRFNH